MDFFISIAGSTQQIIAHLIQSDGTHIGYEVFSGIDVNETEPNTQMSVFRSIPIRLARFFDTDSATLLQNCSEVSLAVSGTDHRFDNQFLIARLRTAGFKNILEHSFHFYSIAEAVYRGAVDNEPGLIIRSGLGNSVFGVNKDGRSHLVAGWGFITDDLGSGYVLGKRVLNIIFKEFDGIASVEEKRIASEALKLENMQNGLRLIEDLNHDRSMYGNIFTLRRVRNLSTVLFNQAQLGNNTANEILDQINDYLFHLASAVLGRLSLNDYPFNLIFHGSVFAKHPAFAKNLFAKIKSNYSNVRYVDSTRKYYSLGIGAAKLIIYSLYDKKERKAVLKNLEESLKKYENNDEIFWQPIHLECDG